MIYCAESRCLTTIPDSRYLVFRKPLGTQQIVALSLLFVGSVATALSGLDAAAFIGNLSPGNGERP